MWKIMTLTSGSLAQFLRVLDHSEKEHSHSERKPLQNLINQDMIFYLKKRQKPNAKPPNRTLLITFTDKSGISEDIINMKILAKNFSGLFTGKTITDSSILFKDLDHSDKSVENNKIGLGKNCALMWNSGKLGTR